MDEHAIKILRELGIHRDRLREIPEELAKWVAGLTPEKIWELKDDIRELERFGLLPLLKGNGAG